MIKLYRYDIAQIPEDEYVHRVPTLPDELRARIDRMAHTDDRKRTLAGHLLILRAAQELCGVSDPMVLRTAAGKPYFADLPLRFSLSHSAQKVILAVSDREIGADIEQIRPRSLGLARRFYTPLEQAYVFGKVPDERDFALPQAMQDDAFLRRFYAVWTKKEAYGKWQGGGLSAAMAVDTATLSFYTEDDGEYALVVYEE